MSSALEIEDVVSGEEHWTFSLPLSKSYSVTIPSNFQQQSLAESREFWLHFHPSTLTLQLTPFPLFHSGQRIQLTSLYCLSLRISESLQSPFTRRKQYQLAQRHIGRYNRKSYKCFLVRLDPRTFRCSILLSFPCYIYNHSMSE
jgi:hypothetical protein